MEKKKNKVGMTLEDAEKLLSEAYINLEDTKIKANSTFSTTKRFINDASDMSVLGKQLTEMLRLKLDLSKLGISMAKVIMDFNKNKVNSDDDIPQILDEETLKALEKISKNR